MALAESVLLPLLRVARLSPALAAFHRGLFAVVVVEQGLRQRGLRLGLDQHRLTRVKGARREQIDEKGREELHPLVRQRRRATPVGQWRDHADRGARIGELVRLVLLRVPARQQHRRLLLRTSSNAN
eukprot:4539861-Pleurochrysis_carterae.AAC.1